MTRLVKFVLVAIAMVSVYACCTKDVTPLAGEWVIEEVNGKETVGETIPFIGFNQQDSTVYGSNSCNRFFGSIVYDENDGSAISFMNVGSTKMLCANSPMEDEIQAAINVVASFSYTDNGGAELLDANDTVIMLLSPKKAE